MGIGLISFELKKIFGKYKEIKLVYLFGSRAEKRAGPMSDYDFAIYFDEKTSKKKQFRIKLKLITELSKILKNNNIDVVVLNDELDPLLKYEIISKRKVLYEKKPYRLMIEPMILSQYFDFYTFKERKNMTNIRVLIKKISEIEKYFKILKRYRKYTQKQIENNLDLKGAVKRYLYLFCQATLDFADALISYLSFRTPSTYGEIFEILEENEIISKDIASKMKKMAGFRNILAHQYVKIRFDEVYRVLTKDIDDVNKFLEAGKVKIKLKLN